MTTTAPARAYADDEEVALSDDQESRLRVLNLGAGVLHLLTGLAMIVLGNDFELPVSTLSLNGPPGTPLSEGTLERVVGVPLALGTATFAFLSAFFHFLVASPLGRDRYQAELRRGRNRFRWVEYSISATLMIVLIALITGVTDLAALIAIAFVNASMILFGWIMEMVNSRSRPTWWTPFTFGSIAGIGPWVAIFGYLAFNVTREGAEGPPGFVYGILATIFVLFNCFAVNQWLQYRRIGPWSDYLFGERVYIVLSFVAKSLLAWQIFVNTLV